MFFLRGPFEISCTLTRAGYPVTYHLLLGVIAVSGCCKGSRVLDTLVRLKTSWHLAKTSVCSVLLRLQFGAACPWNTTISSGATATGNKPVHSSPFGLIGVWIKSLLPIYESRRRSRLHPPNSVGRRPKRASATWSGIICPLHPSQTSRINWRP
jgi:hypothetical protein